MTCPRTEKVISIEEVEYDDYVYDLEVDDVHTFIANDIFVHNTDSIFVSKDGQEIPAKEIDIAYYNYYKELLANFNTNYEREYTNPETGENEILNYWIAFEWEHMYRRIIIVAKKRYYFLEETKEKDGTISYKVKTQGGAFKKRDTNPLAAKLQKQLVSDILHKKYDKNAWVKTMLEWKEKCYENKIPVEYLQYSKGYARHWTEYGQPVIDGKTGKLKKNAAGEQMYAPIQSHIEMIKRLEQEGKQDFQVGSFVKYIIAEPLIVDVKTPSQKKEDKDQFNDALILAANENFEELRQYLLDNKIMHVSKSDSVHEASIPETEDNRTEDRKTNRRYKKEFKEAVVKFAKETMGIEKTLKYLDDFNIKYKIILASKQRAISIEEYEQGAKYNHDAYWGRIISPIIEILNVSDKEAIQHEYKNCWKFSEKQLEKLLATELVEAEEKSTF